MSRSTGGVGAPSSAELTLFLRPLAMHSKLHTNNLPITVILNPNSGPIKDPNDDYLRCIPLLRRDLGAAATITAYVRTDYTKRSATLVNRDVAMYKTWDNIKVDAPGLGKVTLGAPKGIFFDEASNEDSATPIARYKAYAATTRSTFGASAKVSWSDGAECFGDDTTTSAADHGERAQVILNPGTKAAAGYYAYSDFIVSYESAYSQYSCAEASCLPGAPLSLTSHTPAAPPTRS